MKCRTPNAERRTEDFQGLEVFGRKFSNGCNSAFGFRRSAFIAALATLVSLNVSAGSWHTSVGNVDSRVAQIAVESAFEKLPDSGYAPLRLVVENRMGQAGTWDFSFRSSSSYGKSKSFQSSARVEVSARAQRIVEVMVPVTGTPGGYSYPHLIVNVRGPGCSGSMATWSSHSGYSGNQQTSATAMSDSLAIMHWGRIESECKTASPALDLNGTQFDIAKAPGDHRGWAGVDSVWITETDWTGLDAVHRQALLDWTKLGGSLHVCFVTGSRNDPLPDLPQGDGRIGLGSFARESAKDGTKFVARVIAAVRAEPALEKALHTGYGSVTAWGLRDGIPPIVIHTGLIMLFVCLFAVLIGPANLFLLARRKKHMHLFWTTPALSIAASIGLALVIILQDGFGGSGNRFAAVYLDPNAHKAFVVQEQVARSGVLLNRTIPVRDAFFITHVNTENASATTAYGRYAAASGDDRAHVYDLGPDVLSGDWFTSRTVDGHLLSQVQPTRARVEISAGPNGPTVISGIDATLIRIFYRDIQQQLWVCGMLKTGERRQMERATAADFAKWWGETAKPAGGYLGRLNSVQHADEFFYASANTATPELIPTLPAISWKNNSLVYFGPVAAAGGGP